MKCPFNLTIAQRIIYNFSYNDDSRITDEEHIFMERQIPNECDKEECACWDKTTQSCKRSA